MEKNACIPRLFFNFPTQIFHFVGLPLYFMFFILIYKPMGIVEFLNIGPIGLEFNIVIISAILLLVLVGTRLAFYFLREKLKPTPFSYIGWCFCELFIFCFFAAIFISLMSSGAMPYFNALTRSALCFFGVLLWPYVIIALGTYLYAHEVEIKEDRMEENLIRFKDEAQKLKLVVAAPALLYVEAKENYVTIVYLDGDNIKKYLLRSSMKRLEDLMRAHGILRCQRAYYVNPAHVKVLRKDNAGFVFADLDVAACQPIPVSKTYYEEVAAKL